MKKKKQLQKAISTLRDAREANIEAHRCAQDALKAYEQGDNESAKDFAYQKRFYYRLKASKIRQALGLIRKFDLPIRYGYGYDDYDKNKKILYFDHASERAAFHYLGSLRGIKKFTGAWRSVIGRKLSVNIS